MSDQACWNSRKFDHDGPADSLGVGVFGPDFWKHSGWAERAKTSSKIGAEFGGMSAMLAEHCRGARRTVSPPSIPHRKREFHDWLNANSGLFAIWQRPVSTLFGELGEADAWIVGRATIIGTRSIMNSGKIEAISRRDGKPVLVFLHDVAWPCGRRDFLLRAHEQIPRRIPASA